MSLRTVTLLCLLCLFTLANAQIQSSLICSKIKDFNACSNKFALQAAGCSSAVVDTPTLEFYQCQCDAYTGMNQCFMLCPDDVAIQQQYAEIRKTQSSTCQAVDDLRKQGFTTSTTTSTTKTTTPSTIRQTSAANQTSTDSTFPRTTDTGILATVPSTTSSNATSIPPMGTAPVIVSLSSPSYDSTQAFACLCMFAFLFIAMGV